MKKVCQHCGGLYVPKPTTVKRQKFCDRACYVASITFTPEQRVEAFWRMVDKSGRCWIYKGGKDRFGYGRFSVGGGKLYSAPRFSYELAHGQIPKGVDVLHVCGNKSCVKLAHLRLSA